jgi:hypothetical protein
MYFGYLRGPLPPLYELARPNRWEFDYSVTRQNIMGILNVDYLKH